MGSQGWEGIQLTGLAVSQMCFAKAIKSLLFTLPFISKYFVNFDSGHINNSQKREEGKMNLTETWRHECFWF